ncbi:MAG: phosphoenolpyruvate synthase [Nanoarchaeota archaeon]|nr:phosphoenolpyruvate synthase [Nanoarchaeota archaeon]MBU1643956.1 phosphoenolpyruvate synthase [Nanoarchaeota archaeon]MBU1977393.1 phosphoenolpyruvate synthase [Nanoarchaeota archaeon]
MSYVAWFKDLGKDSIGVAGGKGTNLGIMFNLGLPVPGGFAVTAQTYLEYTQKTNIKTKIEELLKGLDVEDNDQLQATANRIQELIVSTPIPEEIAEEIKDSYELLGAGKEAHDLIGGKEVFVAVRSSATAEDLPEASFAGQQATFLNVKGKEKVVSAVLACWASLFTARAIYYREKNHFDHSKVLISAIVQKMVNSDQSGIMFTINPSTNNDKELVIEAVYGLGEMIVGGEINPDLYIVDKETKKIKKIEVRKQEIGMFRDENGKNIKRKIPENLQTRQVIPDTHIKELARLGKKIEEHYGKPQDIEWAIEKNDVFIVQSRAVTTFKKTVCTGERVYVEEDGGKILLKGETASPGSYSGMVKIVKDASELGKIQKGDVLVTTMTTPDMVPAMQRAGAIVTNEGGMTCHAAIVSREMGIPCIVGTENATEVLKDQEIVTVHATRGLVYEGKVGIKDSNKDREERAEEHPDLDLRRGEGGDLITATEIKVIMDIPDFAERAAATGADGVGLVRLEIIIANGGVHPAQYIREGKEQDYINLLKEGIGKIAKSFPGKPVWVRCSDMRTDEYRNLKGGDQEPRETDPMIGWHAIRRLLDEPKILKAEFQAIKELHDSGLKNVGVMIPFVIRTEEIRKAKAILREIGLEPGKDIDFGVMVETPASCWIIEDLCAEGISFVSFGTNDLTQLTLGIDRNNQRIAKLFDEMHPAVLGELAKVIRVCKKNGVKTSICGQAGSRPEMARFLVKEGIDSISANADAVDDIRHTVAKTEKKLLLDAEREELERKN